MTETEKSSLPSSRFNMTLDNVQSSSSGIGSGAKCNGTVATVTVTGVEPGGEKNRDTKKKKKKKHPPVTANLFGTKYDVVRRCAVDLGFINSKEDDPNCYLQWNDSYVSSERVAELKPYQRINHFPGMGEICRKDCLARNMSKMAKVRPDEYSFVPKTWIFPSEYSAFVNNATELRKKKKHKTFIVKPANGAMGNGIHLYRSAEKVPQNDHMIVQEYCDKPFLIDGFKFDLRIYVLVTSCDPLRVFLYNDGLVRLSTEPYASPQDTNIEQLYMHLTNYSINKHSENYEKCESNESGSKRSIKFLNQYLRENDYDTTQLWRSITDMIIKTMVLAEPHILHAYRMCRPGHTPGGDSVSFEVLGFDVLLDDKLRPWLLEVNRSPSFATDEKIDNEIKSGLLTDTLRLLNIRASDKRKNMAAQKAAAQKRLLQPHKRPEGELTDSDRKRLITEKKKEELRELLAKIRRDAAREDFENRNCGRFRRIFPPDDKFKLEKYINLLVDSLQVFMSGRASSMQREIQWTYKHLREEDILDMLAECEADENYSKSSAPGGLGVVGAGSGMSGLSSLPSQGSAFGNGAGNRANGALGSSGGRFQNHGPKPLSSMPMSKSACGVDDFDEEIEDDNASSDSSSEDSVEPISRKLVQNNGRGVTFHGKTKNGKLNACRPYAAHYYRRENEDEKWSSNDLPAEGQRTDRRRASSSSSRPSSGLLLYSNRGKKTSHRPLSSGPSGRGGGLSGAISQENVGAAMKEREEELTRRTLVLLNEMRIKFPGKSDDEAEWILNSLQENWKFHKPRIASYWLVKLDSIKRRKVIDIVRSNVRAVLQRAWHTNDIESLKLSRIFNRVFNRLLWSHGQGLWNCFSGSGKNSWETIFNKSSEVIAATELNCCKRIVHLCRDCLLIVYQFAAEAKSAAAIANQHQQQPTNATVEVGGSKKSY